MHIKQTLKTDKVTPDKAEKQNIQTHNYNCVLQAPSQQLM